MKVNCVLVGVGWFSSKLVPPWTRGGEENAAAFAMAAEMIPWSDFAVGSPKFRVSENHRGVLNFKGGGIERTCGRRRGQHAIPATGCSGRGPANLRMGRQGVS